MQSFKKIGIKLYEQLCSRGHCLYVEGEKKDFFIVGQVTKNDLNHIQTTGTSSYHGENACKVP